jgi:hypothetical protein
MPLASTRTGPCSQCRRCHTQDEIQRGRRRPDTASDTHRWRSGRRSRGHTGPRTDTSYHGMGPLSLRGRCSNTYSVRIVAPQERPYASFPKYFFPVSLRNYRNTSSRVSGIVAPYPSSPLSGYITTFLRTLIGITELSPQKERKEYLPSHLHCVVEYFTIFIREQILNNAIPVYMRKHQIF